MGEANSDYTPAAGKVLSPENLAEDFGAKAEVTRQGVRALSEALLAVEPAELHRWKRLLGHACGYEPGGSPAGIKKLAECYGAAAGQRALDATLFALHTYYAILVNLLLGQIMACRYGLPTPTEKLLKAHTGERLRHEMEEIAAGGFLRELDVVSFFRGDPFSWYTSAWSAPIEGLIRRLAARLARYDPGTLWPTSADSGLAVPAEGSGLAVPAEGDDLWGRLYQDLLPSPLRHKLGEYYTPDWLVDHVLETVGYQGNPRRRLLDPACGSGGFLVRAIRRILAAEVAGCKKGDLCRQVLTNVVGFDLNPLAVIAARASYLVAIAELLPHDGPVEIPIHLCDSILDGPEQPAGRFDYVVGNPPWIAWDHLPKDYRRATKPLWVRYGLFSLSGAEGRHGGGKKDLSMLMMHTSADRYLKPHGRLAMVITQTLFQTKGAGDGFRRFRLGPQGVRLKVLRVDDLVALRPFPDAANWTSTIVLEKGAATQYPVPYVKWSPGEEGGERFVHCTYQAEPIEPTRPGSPWFLRPPRLTMARERLIGRSDYVAHLGANSGGANGVYWVQVLGVAEGGVRIRNLAGKGKRTVPPVEHVVEPDLLYPLVRWGEVTRYHARPSASILLAQNVATRTGIDETLMRRKYPRTFAYLQRFARILTGRAAYRRYQQNKPFYSMYNVGRYTVAPIKVVWRRMDRRINAAVIEEVDHPWLGPRPVIPQETCVLIACRFAAEAHYLCAVLNSSIVNFLVAAHSVRGGKGFGTPSLLDFVKLRRFNPNDPRHEELAVCSREAHATVAVADTSQKAAVADAFPGIRDRIDRLTAALWGLERTELDAIRSA